MIYLACILWYFLGVTGFIFWWTKEFDLTITDLPLTIFLGFTGPINWLAGWFIHGREETSRILFNRRKRVHSDCIPQRPMNEKSETEKELEREQLRIIRDSFMGRTL